jgi:hypothetical protein
MADMDRISRARRAFLGGQRQIAEPGEVLAALKKTLKESPQFSEAWIQFHDEVASDPRFTTDAQCIESERMESVLSTVIAKVLSQKNKVSNATFLYMPEHGFWHGPCDFGNYMVVFFYFEDIDMGLVGITRSLSDPLTTYVRFSMVELGRRVMTTTKRGSA